MIDPLTDHAWSIEREVAAPGAASSANASVRRTPAAQRAPTPDDCICSALSVGYRSPATFERAFDSNNDFFCVEMIDGGRGYL